MKFHVLGLHALLSLIISSLPVSATQGSGESCEQLLSSPPTVSKITLEDLARLDESNPILRYPALAMTSGQKYYRVLSQFPAKTVKDPVFRVTDVQVHPAFVMGIPGVKQSRMIVGQYAGLDAIAAHIQSAALGEKGGKMLGVVGPSGTGKTESFIVLDSVLGKLATVDPSFKEFTFTWTGLEKISSLRGLTPRIGGELAFATVKPDMPRSPFTLLRADIQNAVLAEIGPLVDEKLGFDLKAWKKPAPKDAEIIEHIFAYHVPEIAAGEKTIQDLSDEEYVSILNQHVRIVERSRAKSDSPDIVRALGANPDMGRVFASLNAARSVLYTPGSPLSWDFTGQILQKDGGALVLDEVLRNEVEVTDSMLEVAQNGVAATDGPPVEIDVVTMFTGNDESVASAKEKGDLKAFLDRSHIVPMRLNLHPYEIMKTAIMMVGAENFLMRPLGSDTVQKLVPLDINLAFPLPERDGTLVGIHRRYALYYKRGRNQDPILISPHTLELLAKTAAMTRLVTDAKELARFKREFEQVTPQQNYFTNPVARLKMILGLDTVNQALRAEIAKLSMLAREGEKGISARDIQSWIKESLRTAAHQGLGVMTPEMVDAAFKSLLDKGTIKPSSDTVRSTWLDLYSQVKVHFILPGLDRDLKEMISGHGERAERLYDTVLAEFLAVSADPTATTWMPDNDGTPRAINPERLFKIKKKYFDIHKRVFSEGFLLKHLTGANKESRNKELLAAVEAYLVETEVDILDDANAIIDYNSGRNVKPESQRKAAEVDSRLHKYGYDQASFKAALSYLQVLKIEDAKTKK